MDDAEVFHEWIKRRRKMLDLTQEELAQRAGCSVFALRKIETGERRPSKQLAGLLAAGLEIPPAEQATFIRVARGELNLERLRPPVELPAAGPACQPVQAAPPEDVHPHCRLRTEPGYKSAASPLVGRLSELAALERLFNDPQCRLLTLTGLGGVGKTRLAAGFIAARQGAFPGGVYFVPLAALNSPDLIAPAIAEAFGLALSGPVDTKEQLLSYLAVHTRQPTLLVLDNFEHLLAPQPSVSSPDSARPAAIDLVLEMLQRLPGIRLLVTSRERLNLQGEWMLELHGLQVPEEDFTCDPDAYGALQLFVLCARRVKPDFAVREEELPALIRICRLIEGIPLAIELAAAWAGMLSPAEIAAEIEAGLDFLTSTMHDIPGRHRSLRATFDHSWELLPKDERTVLQRLAVFHGGFSRHAAGQVAGASLPALASLHARSLVLRTESGRYDLHEVIRQYARPYFEQDPQQQEICERHSAYYLGFVRDHEKPLKSAAQQAVTRELAAELDNLRAAWALRHEQFTLLGEAVRSYAWLCHVAGWLSEGIELIETLVQALRLRVEDRECHKLLGHTLGQQGLLYFRKGRFEPALACYTESVDILRRYGDSDLLAYPLVYRGILLHLTGQIEAARALMEEGLTCARLAGKTWIGAYALYNLGYLDSLAGQHQAGYEQMLAGLARWRERGDPSSIALGLNFIAPTAVKLGYLEQARRFLEESLALCTQVGDRWGMGTAYRNLGMTALAQGNPAEAQVLLHKSLEVFGEYIVGWDIALSLTYLGDAARLQGDLEGAQKNYQQAVSIAQGAHSAPVALDALVGLAHVHWQNGEQGQALALAHQVLEHPAAVRDTRDRATRLLEQLRGAGQPVL